MLKNSWWSGFAAGITLGLLLYSGASLLLLASGSDEDLVDMSSTFEIYHPELLTCACDYGHAFEAPTCGVSFDMFGSSFGPYCQLHIGEFLDAEFPKAWSTGPGSSELEE